MVISILSVSVSVYFAIHNSKRADNTEIERKARETATIDVKLNEIGNDVKDIKYDITAVKRDVQALSKQVVIVEQSTKSAHKRLDVIERRLNFDKEEIHEERDS